MPGRKPTDLRPEEEAVIVEWYRSRIGQPVEIAALAAQLNRAVVTVARAARRYGLTTNHRAKPVVPVHLLSAGRQRSIAWQALTDQEKHAKRSAAMKARHAAHGHPHGGYREFRQCP